MLRRSLFASPSATSSSSPSSISLPTLFLQEALRLASKSSGTNTKYQRRPSKDKDVGVKIYLGQPMKKGMDIIKQRHRYDHRYGFREPDFHAGKNVAMDPKVYTLTAKTDGIPTIRKSDINPEYEWFDVEEDIQKVYRTRAIRKHFKHYSGASHASVSALSEQHNRDIYGPELKDLKDPDWRQRVVREIPLTERFPDPNLLCRGVVDDITPKSKYFYE